MQTETVENKKDSQTESAQADSVQRVVRRYVVTTLFKAIHPGRHWWNDSYTTYPHRMTVLPAPDGETAEAVAAAKDKQYWEKQETNQNLGSLTLLSVVWMQAPNDKLTP